MRIGLTVKLLMVLGITSAVSVLAMGFAARWSFQHGFLDYLGQKELQLIGPLEEALVEAYEENGSWDQLRKYPARWPKFVDDALALGLDDSFQGPMPPVDASEGEFAPRRNPSSGPAGGASPRPPPRHGHAPPFPPPRRPPPRFGPSSREGRPFVPPRGLLPPEGPDSRPPPGPAGLARRLQLLDARRHIVAGEPAEVGESQLISLESNGVVIGWLGLSPPVWLDDELAQRFHSQHNRSLVWVAVGSLAFATLLGWVFGEGILRRIRSVAREARRLAKGDYETRLSPKGRDELTGLAEDFNYLAAALERNEALRRSGMADISHELRTPVAVARAELDALIDGIRPCTKERLEQLQSRLLTLVRLLDDLYDLALSDAGALSYQFAPLDLGEMLDETVAEFRAAFAEKGLELDLEPHGESAEALYLEGDRGRLRQVLDNLLGNSLRYTDAGGFTRIAATRTGHEIRVVVSDTPPGVNSEALAQLFDRFFRVEVSRSRAKGGAGLGLAICRNIVEAHRGSIEARAADSGGLEIEIRLPATD